MNILGIIGFLLLITAGANDGNVSVWGMLLQFLIGLALFFPGYLIFIRKEVEKMTKKRKVIEIHYAGGFSTFAVVYEEKGREMYRHLTCHSDGTETIHPKLYPLDRESYEHRIYEIKETEEA